MSGYLIVGLGNPGKEFENTPHNIGFGVLDRIADEYRQNWKKVKPVFGEVSKFSYKSGDVILLKPLTFMNKSGLAVKSALRFWKIDLSNLLVVQDDSDIEIGRLKIGYNQSSGGHKGLDSIIQSLGNQEFSRLRLGIRPRIVAANGGGHIKAEKFILKFMSPARRKAVFEQGKEAACFWLENGLEKAMSRYNKRKSKTPNLNIN